CSNDGAFRKEASRAMDPKYKSNLSNGRRVIKRLAMRHEEFLAVFGIMFWTTEGLDVSEAATLTSEMCR
ncbi:hypothetical protein PENTCL1PPCAC_21396, partial [Pristionchus entomophagus]